MKKPLIMFIIAALLIIAGAMAFQAYKHGAFDGVKATSPDVPAPAHH